MNIRGASNLTKLLVAVFIGAALALLAVPASAHGFGVRYTLPVPLNYFLIGAAATVAASFVVIGLFVNKQPGGFSYPRYNLLAAPVIGPLLSSPVFVIAVQIVSVLLFTLTLATALFGTSMPIENWAPTWVWIIWWVGMGYIVAIFGNLWAVVNPWKIIYGWFETVFGDKNVVPEEQGMFDYQPKWDVWPAVVLFFSFAWIENVYTSASLPFRLGLLILAYSAITWGGMVIFGKHRWLRNGETFSVLFGFFARFSPTEVRVTDETVCKRCSADCTFEAGGCVDCLECFERAPKNARQLNLRPYAVGLANPGNISPATAIFVILALATVTFDGLSETRLWINVQNAMYPVFSFFGATAIDAIDTLGMLLVPVLFLLLYMGFCWAIRQIEGTDDSVFDVAKSFAFSLVPIALAYNMTHFIALLAIQGQAVIPLASDPFGFGWDLFGTGAYRLNIDILSPQFVWYFSIVAIVLGHIISVYIAHVVSLRRVPDASRAVKSQYPMLALMVLYTATSLVIIAQPIVESGGG